MHEIKCPHCGETFNIDDTGYAAIMNQVRDEAFDKALHDRIEDVDRAKSAEVELAKATLGIELREATSKQEVEIERLKEKLQASAELVKAKVSGEFKDDAVKKDTEIERLKSDLKSVGLTNQLALKEALDAVEKERDDLERDLDAKDAEQKIIEASLKTQYEIQIKERDGTIERLKDMKARLSTKMVGETLEQHCEIEFNKLRSAAFPGAYFEKDNDAKSGSKGDYIFRDSDDGGTEFISIMFEMKNEIDTTGTKKKNEEFLKELDKDRNEKGCEYAVLVSLLEPENDLYNAGNYSGPLMVASTTSATNARTVENSSPRPQP